MKYQHDAPASGVVRNHSLARRAGVGSWIVRDNGERLHADPRRGAESELDNSANALRDAGRVMAKISKQISPSVVHIESLHRTMLRGEVEETGSGVIVKSSHTAGEFVGVNVTGRETKGIRFKGDVNIQSRDSVIVRGAEFQGRVTIRSQRLSEKSVA